MWCDICQGEIRVPLRFFQQDFHSLRQSKARRCKGLHLLQCTGLIYLQYR